MTRTTTFIRAGTLFAIVGLSACGGGTPTSNPTPAPTPATPAATIAATGSGSIVIHPSIDARFGAALETPLRLIESAGGTADWNFARFQLYPGAGRSSATRSDRSRSGPPASGAWPPAATESSRPCSGSTPRTSTASISRSASQT